MSPAEVTDATAADFAGGSHDGSICVGRAECSTLGEVLLAPAVHGDFSGGELPAGWTISPVREGGTGTMGGDGLTLDGARVACEEVFRGPRRVLDFAATFAARPDQHVGFGIDFVRVPWVMISTRWGRRLHARSHNLLPDDKKIDGTWFEEPHRYRIEWGLSDIAFSIDGERVAYLLVPVFGYMCAIAANHRSGGAPLHVAWMRVSPYAPTGTFTSRVLDAGSVVDWQEATWLADTPTATRLELRIRSGDEPRPGRSWSRWRRLPATGAPVGVTARYLQYRAVLATADDGRTPVLHQVRFRFEPRVL